MKEVEKLNTYKYKTAVIAGILFSLSSICFANATVQTDTSMINNKNVNINSSSSINKKVSDTNTVNVVFFKDIANGFGESTFVISQKKLNTVLNKNNTIYSTNINLKKTDSNGFNVYNTDKTNIKDNNKTNNLKDLEKDEANVHGFIGYKIFISNFKENDERVSFDERILNNKISAISYNKSKNKTHKMLSKKDFGTNHINIKKDRCFIVSLDKEENLYAVFYLNNK